MQISENDIKLQAQLIADETVVWGCACHVDENCRQTISWQEPTPGVLRRRTGGNPGDRRAVFLPIGKNGKPMTSKAVGIECRAIYTTEGECRHGFAEQLNVNLWHIARFLADVQSRTDDLREKLTDAKTRNESVKEDAS